MVLTRDDRIVEHIRMAVLGCIKQCAYQEDHYGAVTQTVRSVVSRVLPGAAEELQAGKWDHKIYEFAQYHYSRGIWPKRLAEKNNHLAKRNGGPVPAPEGEAVLPAPAPAVAPKGRPKKPRPKSK